jgi:hypothetical protein
MSLLLPQIAKTSFLENFTPLSAFVKSIFIKGRQHATPPQGKASDAQ